MTYCIDLYVIHHALCICLRNMRKWRHIKSIRACRSQRVNGTHLALRTKLPLDHMAGPRGWGGDDKEGEEACCWEGSGEGGTSGNGGIGRRERRGDGGVVLGSAVMETDTNDTG